MRSKAFQALESKLSYFDDDIELIDVIKCGISSGDLTETGSRYILKHVDPVNHAHLARRKNSNGGRTLIINHLRSTIYASYVKDVYEEVTEYLRTILRKVSQNGFNAGRLVGDHSFKVDAKAILELGSWEKVCIMVTDSVFQSLESEKSTLKLLEKMASKLALDIDRNLINSALPYLEVRHFLVHTDGKLSVDYMSLHPHIPSKKGYIDLNYSFINGLRLSVKALMADYDKEVINKQLLKAEDLQP